MNGWCAAIAVTQVASQFNASRGLLVPPAATFSTWVYIMVMLTSLWPSNSCTVRISVPD